MKYQNLGLCCQFLHDDGFHSENNILVQRILQLNRYKRGLYTSSQIKQLYVSNIKTLLANLPRVFATYKVFRFPSGFFPLYDLVDETLWNNDEIITLLQQLGSLVKRNDVRATFHPGQFCSLSSDSDDVRAKSIVEINHHAWIFDSMGLDASPFYAINVHGGKADRSTTLINTINNLLPTTRSRLTLENDESCYSVGDLLHVFKATGTPIVFDSHHHAFNNDGLTHDEAYNACLQTWGSIKPKQHVSSTTPGLENSSYQDRRKHSNYITGIPKCQYDGVVNNKVDLMIEAKLKNLSVEHLRTSLDNLSLGNVRII